MKISSINKNQTTFTGNSNNIQLFESLKECEKTLAEAIKNKSSQETFKAIQDRFSSIEKLATAKIEKKKIPTVFVKLVQWFGKVKTGNKALDTAALLTKVVLWGNVGKEITGTALYTVQALTNQDLEPDKRKFVGMYDLAVGLVSTCCSFIFGIGLEKSVKDVYKKILKPLTKSHNPSISSRAEVAIVGLAAFSSFALQTIVGKRIIAPAIATPIAGKMKAKMEAQAEAKKKGNEKPQDLTPGAFDSNIFAHNDFKQKLNM